MSTSTKSPTYPTAADITAEIANITPDGDRYRAIWKAATDALNQLENTSNPLDALAVHAANTGEIPTPEQMLNAGHAALTEDRDRAYVAGQLETIRRRYVTAPTGPTTEQAEQILSYLSTDALPSLLDAVRALPKGTPLTADDALTHEDGPRLYRTAQALLATYDAIRTQQRRAVDRIASSTMTTDAWPTMVAHSGQYRDATEHDPYWLKIRRDQHTQFRTGLEQYRDSGKDNGAHDYFTATPERDHWPAQPERATWPTNHDDDEQRARWLIRAAHDLELWVPTFEQLNTDHAENRARTSVQAWIGSTTKKGWMIDRLGNRRITETESVAGVKVRTRTTTAH